MARMRALDLLRTVHRSFYIQGAWNYERMLGLGYCFCLVPFARKVLKSPEQVREFLKRNLGFFNTHPYMAGWILGAAMKLDEENLLRSGTHGTQTERFKKKMSEFLGALGDRLFWSLLKPLTAVFGFLVALHSEVAGLLVFIGLYNAPHFYVRFKGVFAGYRRGTAIVKDLAFHRFNRLHDRLRHFAAFVAGVSVVWVWSNLATGWNLEGSVLLTSAGGTFLILRKKVMIPATLLLLLLLSVVAGQVLTGYEF